MFEVDDNHKKTSRYFVFFTCMLLFLQSCIKDFPDTFPTEYDWKPTLAFPIGETDFGLTIPHGFDTMLMYVDSVSGFPNFSLLEKIPLYGGIAFDFEEVLGRRDEIDLVVLRFNTYNGFPIEVEIQAYLEDNEGTVLDSFFVPRMIMARGELLACGETATQVHSQREVLFDADRLDVLMDAKRITFRGELNSVDCFPSYTFKVQLGIVIGIISNF